MLYKILVAAVLAQGLSGIGGGLALLLDPSGAAIGLPQQWLEGTPFSDYAFPALVLSTVLGIGPLVVAWGLWRRDTWSWYGAVLVGLALASWLLVEILTIGYQTRPPLQLVYGLLALLILVLSLLPATRRLLLGS